MAQRVLLESIVHAQGQDYELMLDEGVDPYDSDAVFEYLSRWWFPTEHMEMEHDYEDINTPFLGYEYKIWGCTFLMAVDNAIGYATLSRILETYED